MVVMTVSGRFGMAMGVLRRGLMGVVTMCSGGVAVIIVAVVAGRGGWNVIVVCGVPVIIMAVRRRRGMTVVIITPSLERAWVRPLAALRAQSEARKRSTGKRGDWR